MKMHEKIAPPALSEYWNPPTCDALDDGVGSPVSCLATSYEFDAGFFENELLPRFLGLRFDHTERERAFVIDREEALACTHVAVLVDASKFDPRQTTMHWDQLKIQVPGGIQHAKVTMLVWERFVRLIMGSANLTNPGYRRNRELFAVLDFFNGSDSVPLNILHEAIRFVDSLCEWSKTSPAVKERTRAALAQIWVRVRGWSKVPKNLNPKLISRVVGLAVSHPKLPSGSAQSTLKQLIGMWGRHQVLRLRVMTPFVGQQGKAEDSVLRSIQGLPLARNAEGWLIAPEEQAPERTKRRIVPMPRQFGQCWKNLFGENSRILLVPKSVEDGDEKQLERSLHAKTILIEGKDRAMMMVGSSNFTPHGLGVGAHNCEANLVFADKVKQPRDGNTLPRDNLTFHDRLGIPVPWRDALDVDAITWQDPKQPPDDEPSTKPQLPAFFAWASYSQITGEIRVVVDRNEPEPSDWTISFLGQSEECSASLFSRSSCASDGTTLTFTLDEKERGVHLVALRVSWMDKDSVPQGGFLAVAVHDRDNDLLPPEEFRGLSLDRIIDHLLSGQTPAEWVDKQAARCNKRKTSTDAAIDSLRAVDTSNYVLYRVRRFGRALAAMASHIERTSRTPEAIRYRLFLDPFGPVHLAEALTNSGNGHDGGCPSGAEIGYRLFAMAELLLLMGQAGQKLRRDCERDSKWILPLFRETGERIRAVIQRTREQSGSVPDDLDRYLNASFSENARLLKVAEKE